MALLLVVMMVALITILTLSFVTKVGFEQTTAKSFSDAGTSSALADSAVNLVIAQISQATEGYDPNSTSTPWAWASQPGAIRTYDTTGNLANFYKLYSSDKMIVSGTNFSSAALTSDVPQNWDSQYGLYTDLNSPITDSNGNLIFPIIDPRAEGTDPTQSVEGFNYDTGSTPPPDGSVSPTAANGDDDQRLPMPTKWLYVLQDGTMSSATGVNNGLVTLSPAPSQTNPVVGRVAFWTDDETCKININTASEGTYWNKPYTSDPQDVVSYSASIPVQGEFQRISGHPATTCLSPVLGGLISGMKRPVPSTAVYSGSTVLGFSASKDYPVFHAYYSLAPRVNDTTNGSSSGTVTGSKLGTVYVVGGTTQPIVSDNDRLYNSLDELLFAPGLTGTQRTLTSNSISQAATLTPDVLEKAKFFLTADSQAPEVNMFNLPRISLWPLQQNTSERTTKDALLAFSATANTSPTTPYYFQRQSTYRSSVGTGKLGAASSQSTTADWNIARNQSLYKYLENLTSTPIPGIGGSFTNKYTSSQCDQILTEMFDIIRTAVNEHTQGGLNSSGSSLTYDYAISLADKIGLNNVVPSMFTSPNNNPTKGLGTSYTVAEAALTFVGDTIAVAGTPVIKKPAMGGIFSVDLFTPFNPPPANVPACQMVITGLDQLQVNTGTLASGGTGGFVSLGLPATATNAMGNSSANQNQPFAYAYAFDIPESTSAPKTFKQGDPINGYPFYSTTLVPVPTTIPPTFTFKQTGPITIKIYPLYINGVLGGTPTGTTALQTIQILFNNGGQATLPMPVKTTGIIANATAGTSGRAFPTNAQKQIADRTNDTTVSMIIDPNGPSKGDLRMVTALSSVTTNYFANHPSFTSTTTSHYAASLRFADEDVGQGNRPVPDPSVGTASIPTAIWSPATALVAGVPRTMVVPSAPVGTPAALMKNGSPGDWDNGPGNHGDGPFINRVGLGNNSDTANTFNGGYFGFGGNDIALDQYSPNGQVASGVMFGSLPAGIDQSGSVAPWRTLLFCPNPSAGPSHPGFGVGGSGSSGPWSIPPYTSAPPDHLFLDFFYMPVVEPYAISSTFSTAGKINMNYQIAPFTYITRSTGVRAVLKSVRVTAIPSSGTFLSNYSNGYKEDTTASTGFKGGIPSNLTVQTSYDINDDATIQGLQQRFDSGDIFRSASEICNIYMIPSGASGAPSAYPSNGTSTMDTFWKSATANYTGDNAREDPYNAIYPRLTTKSNTYTVHVRAQVLKQVATANRVWATWNENTDQVLSEYNGATRIERYIDPNATITTDFATTGLTSSAAIQGLSPYYKWKVTNLGSN